MVRKLSIHGVLLFLLLSSTTAFCEGDRLTLYSRFSSNLGAPPLNTINALYDFDLAHLFRIQTGIRLGEQAQGWGQFNYKVELGTKRFFDYFSLMTRFTKANSFYPSDSYKSVWVNQLRFRYNLRPFIFVATGGATYASGVNGGSIMLPDFTGKSDWTPTYQAEIVYDNESISQAYALRFSNYDVFDVYSTNTSYFQLQLDQRFKGFTGYIYGRYRYNNTVTNIYSFYLALGAIIPINSLLGHPSSSDEGVDSAVKRLGAGHGGGS